MLVHFLQGSNFFPVKKLTFSVFVTFFQDLEIQSIYSYKQESPPARSEEAYRPLCSKSLGGGGYLIWLGGGVPTLASGGYLSQYSTWGYSILPWGTPILIWPGGYLPWGTPILIWPGGLPTLAGAGTHLGVLPILTWPGIYLPGPGGTYLGVAPS